MTNYNKLSTPCFSPCSRDLRGRDCIVVRFTTTGIYSISAYLILRTVHGAIVVVFIW